MPAGISFGNRTNRDNNYAGGITRNEVNDVGPGSYTLKNTISSKPPSYAPFGSTAARQFIAPEDSVVPTQSPPPIENTGAPKSSSSAAQSAFKGQGPRIPDPIRRQDMTPGPGAYSIPTTIKIKPTPFHSHSQKNFDSPTPPDAVKWSRIATAPSIPGTSQSYGYEEAKNGDLIMQRPANSGFRGEKGDTVGPLDYSPKFTQTYKKTNVLDFSRGTDRPDITSKLAGLKNSNSPGPGDYNLSSGQSISSASSVNHRPPPQLRKKNAVFESKVERLKEKRRYEMLGPGPATYLVPSTLKVESKPDNVQCFGTSSTRFDGKSGVVAPGPGYYGQPMSDFERRALEARRVKVRQPGHREPVPFSSSGGRFGTGVPKNLVNLTAPGSYECTNTIGSDLQKKVGGRSGAFGSTTKRFPTWTDDGEVGEVAAVAAAAPSYSSNMGIKNIGSGNDAGEYSHPRKPHNKPHKGRPDQAFLKSLDEMQLERGVGGEEQVRSSSFASGTNRFEDKARDKKNSVPPVGTYDTTSKWKATSVVPLSSGPKERIPATTTVSGDLGPGQYKLKSTIAVKKGNRKNVFVSTTSRFSGRNATDELPGPGEYQPDYAYGNMIRPTFNVQIAESSRILY